MRKKETCVDTCLFLFDQVYFKCDYLIMYQSTILQNKSQIHSEFLDDDIWNLLDKTYQRPDNFNFNLFEVKEEKYIARPDLISLDAYGDPVFADIICKLNGISNPFELNIGMILIIPTPSDVFNFTQQPPYNEMEGISEDITPQPKKIHEKRKANEAIVGDKRFKIDASKGIVIY